MSLPHFLQFLLPSVPECALFQSILDRRCFIFQSKEKVTLQDFWGWAQESQPSASLKRLVYFIFIWTPSHPPNFISLSSDELTGP
jgi:hypothetical protein